MESVGIYFPINLSTPAESLELNGVSVKMVENPKNRGKYVRSVESQSDDMFGRPKFLSST